MQFGLSRGLLLASTLLLLPACDDDDSDSGDATSGTGTATDDSTTGDSMGGSTSGSGVEAPDIEGTYVENFPGGMATHVISAGSWMTDYGMGPDGHELVTVDNDNTFVVGESTSMAGVFAKLQWTYSGDDLYYCTVVFDAASAEDAAAAPPADDTDPANGGCAGFSWSLLEPA